MHHFSASWVLLPAEPQTFLHASHFWSPLILQETPRFRFHRRSLINATWSLGNTLHGTLSVSLSSLYSSCRSCHRLRLTCYSVPTKSPFYFIQSFNYWELVTSYCCCSSVSTAAGKNRTATNGTSSFTHYRTCQKQTHMVRIKKGASLNFLRQKNK